MNHFTRLVLTRSGKAYLMVLDWEEHESLWVLLQKRLICLLWLDGWCNCDLLRLHLDVLDVRYPHNWDSDVLLVCCREELLGRRVAHLEALNGRCSLSQEYMSVNAMLRTRWRGGGNG
jgi:hypothetical protein